MKIKELHRDDVKVFLELTDQVEREAAYMLMEPGERKSGHQLEKVKAFINDPHSTILIAEAENQWIGYALAFGGKANRNQHTISIVLGVIQDFQGKGAGSSLLNSLEEWARERGIHRIELTTVVKNTAAVHLYKKNGYEIEGCKRDSLKMNNTYVDEYYMAKLLWG
ncbi:N-acetyltransferase [Halobacillus andaensis]|uniref:N-acetyltransferase n=1 Tax=Halobacillus andaensis TaxID=1176239 RepID=A0A917B6E8_HALAA|nr:GNAT family N-acetyltransferase [Halobacillus andaensis]MBP2005829.1 RimJ/RimL family protein N-acetyltransferase [Halobacillus andaensis]GGF25761.1 N-acetyltransferase [Halobacillus andaensis]